MPKRRQVFLYAFGVVTGLVFMSLSSNYNYISKVCVDVYESRARVDDGSSYAVLSQNSLDSLSAPRDVIRFTDKHSHTDDDSLARRLYDQVRVLCWVMTSANNLQKKARHVRATWGHRCNKLLFVSDHKDDAFPTIDITVKEGRNHLTAKTMKAFDYIYKHHYDDADWFIKVDDDTYVIVENLRYFLSSQNTSKPIYFGHRFRTIVAQGYYSGGGGYVFSREALRRFGVRAPNKCVNDSGAEDIEVGKCMVNLGVRTADSRDVLGRSRFHCFGPGMHINGGYPKWYYKWDAYGAKQGIASVSDYAITFHYISPERMYELEYFVYHLAPYGVVSGRQELNGKPPPMTSGEEGSVIVRTPRPKTTTKNNTLQDNRLKAIHPAKEDSVKHEKRVTHPLQ